MAPSATIYRLQIQLSDVDKSVYEALDIRIAQHPSETTKYLLTRAFAYALSYEEGLTFSKGGLSSVDEPPLSVRDPTGVLLAWIEIGAPSAERLHKAAKAAKRVEVYTTSELAALDRELESKKVHRAEEITIWKIDPDLITQLEARLQKNLSLELTRADGQLYVTVAGDALSGPIERRALVSRGDAPHR